MVIYFFFFKSRRRHTIFDCDWSSDVCSSDLLLAVYPKHRRCSTSAGSTTSPPMSKLSQSRKSMKPTRDRSEEHTSELQSQSNLVCRLLLEKKKKIDTHHTIDIVQQLDVTQLR